MIFENQHGDMNIHVCMIKRINDRRLITKSFPTAIYARRGTHKNKIK